MTWIGGFPPSSYIGNIINELKAELRDWHDAVEEEDYFFNDDYFYDKGWYANTQSMIERLEGVADDLRSLEG